MNREASFLVKIKILLIQVIQKIVVLKIFRYSGYCHGIITIFIWNNWR